MRSIRLAFRTLARSPFTSAIAILSLALGIGANAAIFSLFDQMLLRPLPAHEPRQLVNLSAPGPKPGSQSCNQAGDCDAVLSYAMFRDLQSAETALSGIAGHRLFGANVAFDGQTLNGEAALVSGSYFDVLGVQPSRGRLLGPADDETIGGHYVAVLSHDFWQARLGGAEDVVGRAIIINGHPMTIVGVGPPGFEGTTYGARPVAYVPLGMRGVMNPGFTGFDNRRNYWVYAFGRLAPGATLDRATASLNAVYSPIIRELEAPLQEGMSDQTLEQFRAKRLVVEEGRRGQSSVHDVAAAPLLLLFATAGVVLLIACANIANLLLARGAGRGMEMAVRLSLGANRRQVLAQLLTESLVLALLGGVLSLLFARWTLLGIASMLPAEAAVSMTFEVSAATAAFAGVLAIGTGLLFGIFPALHSTRRDLVSTIRANAGNVTATRSAARFRATLVTVQIAMAMMLLVTAALFLRSLVNVTRVDLGLQPENVVTFALSPQLNGYESGRVRILFERVEEELSALPGVTGVTAAMVPILSGSSWANSVSVEGFERGPDVDATARFNEVGPGYFATLGIPLLTGREFSASDDAGGGRVAIVNEAFTRKFNLGRDAVGRYMGMGDDLDMRIVGVARDARYSEVKEPEPPLFYTPWRQDTTLGFLTFYVRTSLPSSQLQRAVPPLVAGIDPNLPIENLKTLPQQVRESIFLDRTISTLALCFAALATLLASIGLYGVLAYTVAQRTREIGVRMALGAEPRAVQRMVLRQMGRMVLVGGVIGLAAAIALGRAASSLLYEVKGHDPLALVGGVTLLGILALAAAFGPAYRAARVDPVTALRYD